MTKISKALSAASVIAYHREQLVSSYERYYSEGGESQGRWFGIEAEAFGLQSGSAVQEEQFTRLANGQDPTSGHQLIGWHSEAQRARWIEDDGAWHKHVEKLVCDAMVEGREIFRENAGGERLVKQSKQLDEKASVPPEHSERAKTLLEMHAIARQIFADNLASEAGSGARLYLRERGIRADTAKEFGLGLAEDSGKQLVERLRRFGPELMDASGLFVRKGNEFHDRFRGRLMFPIENAAGETIAFGARNPPGAEYGAKYINSPETELYKKGDALYNLSRAKERIAETGRAVLVEGYLDAIAAYQAGARNVVAACGTALTEKQVAAIALRAEAAILNFDPDGAGLAATEKHAATLLDAGLNVRAVAMSGDPAEWIPQNGVKRYREAIRDALPLVSYLSDRAREKFDLSDTYGRIDGTRWMVGMFDHVRPEHRERFAAELESHLQTPKISSEEASLSTKASEHRAAWDITYSAPKTFSLTALVGGDHRLMAAWDEGVKEAAAYFERAIQVKMGGLNAPQTTGQMVSAMFRHDTARPVDGYMAPQLHTHQIVFNMSMDREGQHRALDPKELYYLQSSADAVLLNRLGVRAKQYGYQLTFGKNMAVEIGGYTEEYREAESQRREQIKAQQDELGQYGPTASDYIAQNTREAKLDLTPAQVRAAHLEHAEKYGNQPQQVVEAASHRKSIVYSAKFRAEVADEAISFAKECLSERSTVFEWHEIHRHALRFGRGYITLEDVERAFDRRKAEFQKVEHWRSYAPEARYTTPELQAKEREILHWMDAGRGRVRSIAGGITRDEFRATFRDHLKDAQKHLVWKVIHAEDRMIGIAGLAGVGKTRCLATIQDFAVRYGFEVRGIASTSTAVAELRGVGIGAETLASFQLSRDVPHGPRLYLLDEASLTDVHQMAAFLRKLTPADRVMVVGDTKQHASLGPGRVFAELQEAGMKTFHLRKIIRQQHEWYRQAVNDLATAADPEKSNAEAKQNIQAALDALMKDAYRIHELSDERLRHRGIALWYLRDPLHTLVVTPDNRSAAAISETIREARREAGDLGLTFRARILHSRSDLTTEDLRFAGTYQVGDVVEYARRNQQVGIEVGDRASVVKVNREKNQVTVMRESDGQVFTYNPRRQGASATLYEPTQRDFAVGDRVQFTRALKLQGISNRALGTIEALDEMGNVAIRIDGRKELWRGNLEHMPHLDHGYVMTSYRVQSLTSDRVMVHLDTDAPGVSRMLTRELAYVAFSRGRQDIHVFTNSREDLAAALSRSEEKPSALAPEQVKAYRREMRV